MHAIQEKITKVAFQSKKIHTMKNIRIKLKLAA